MDAELAKWLLPRWTSNTLLGFNKISAQLLPRFSHVRLSPHLVNLVGARPAQPAALQLGTAGLILLLVSQQTEAQNDESVVGGGRGRRMVRGGGRRGVARGKAAATTGLTLQSDNFLEAG